MRHKPTCRTASDKLIVAKVRRVKRKAKALLLWGATSRKDLIKKLDAVFSLFIRLRDKKAANGLCVLCRKRPIEVCFHWVSRGDYATRWLPENACGSCRGCNFEETFRKRKYRDLHIARVGIAAREALEAKAREAVKFSTADLVALRDGIKARLVRWGS